MQIKIENLSPKNILNFYLPTSITKANMLVVIDNVDNVEDILLKNILQINGVTKVLAADNMLSVFFAMSDYEDIQALVLAELDDLYHQDYVINPPVATLQDLDMLETLADALIRPTLNRDKGDISVISLNNNVLELQFTGHCAGCPYAQNTLQNVIIKTVQKYMPQIKRVNLKET